MLLSHRFRRVVIDCLCEYDETLTLADLADEVACRCRDETIEDVDAAEVKQTYMALYHTHLPKLIDYGVVEYDKSGTSSPRRKGPERSSSIWTGWRSDHGTPRMAK